MKQKAKRLLEAKSRTSSTNNGRAKISSEPPVETDRGGGEGGKVWDVPVSCMLGCVAAGLYVFTLYPSIPGGDSGELVTSAHELGVAHPPGYPLFTILSWLAIKIVPAGSVIWRVNLLTAILSAGAAVFFSLTIFRLTGSTGSAVLGVALWCFCRLTWTWSIAAEVFGLNNLFTAALLYLLVTFDQADSSNKLQVAGLGAFTCGLSLCNQHTIVLYVIVVAGWVLVELRQQKMLDWVRFVQLSLYFLCGLVPYVYLPLSAYFRPGRWTWGDQTTLSGFLKHFLREEYGTFDLGKNAVGGGLYANLRAYANHCLEEFSYVGVCFILLGTVAVCARVRMSKGRSLLVSIVMMSLYLLFFAWRANLDLDNPLFFAVVERFWMQCDCILVLLASVGLADVSRLLSRVASSKFCQLEVVLAVAIAAFQIQRNVHECNQSNNTVAYEFGARILENMPENTLILTRGDLSSNTLRYLHLCENMRPDLKIFDQEILTYSWSVPMMRSSYPGISFPGHRLSHSTGRLVTGEEVFDFTTFLYSNSDKGPVVFCIGVLEQEKDWESHFTQFPYGPCHVVVKKGSSVDLKSWYKGHFNMTADWKYPNEGFDARSWERVVTDTVWGAKTSMALFLYNMGYKESDKKIKTDYIKESYMLYTEAFESVGPAEVPNYWHKNYALACEQLLQLDHDIDKPMLLRKGIEGFQTFIDHDKHDKDYHAIVNAIQHMKKYL